MAKTTTLTIDQCDRELTAGQIRPVYVVTGEEGYLLRPFLRRLEKLLIEPASQAFDFLVLAEGATDRAIRDALSTPAFLSKKKLVVVKNGGWFPTGRADKGAPFPFPLASPDTCLVLIEETVNKTGEGGRRLAAVTEAGGALLELLRQDEETLLTFIRQRLKRHDLSISRTAARALIERSERALQTLADELDKMALYCLYQEKREIDLELVESMVPQPLSARVFDLMDLVAAGRADRALATLNELLAQKEPLPLISFMLLRQIRHLLVARDLGSAAAVQKKLGLRPFVARKLCEQSRRFTPSALEAIHSQGFQYDVDVRRGLIADRLALELLIASACQQA